MKLSGLFTTAILVNSIIAVLLPIHTQAQTVLWNNRYNGSGDNSDRYNAMLTDASGNFYLTGYTVRPGSGKDFLTAKLNSSGDTLWTRTYDNTLENRDDEAYFIALDGSGNIIVTGASDGGSTNTKTDFLTLKYNASGTLLWSARYNYSTANEDEFPAALMVDGSSNIFITGRSDHDVNNVDDYVTVKYNSSGVEQWASRFDGGFTDRPAGIVTDGAGGCVITGRSSNGSNDDIVTINYSSTGSQNWLNTYSGPAGDDRGQGIGRDGSGNIYVGGTRANASNDDFITLSYSSTGSLNWTQVFNGGDNDRLNSISVDASGNVYVTGQSDIDLGGSADYDFKTIKYNSSGVLQWSALTGYAANQEDTPTSIYVDGSSNVFVCGKSDAASSGGVENFQFMTVKYNSAGSLQWTATYNGSTTNGEDIPAALTTDATGNVWVCGSVNNISTQKDAILVKYNSSGVFQAAKSYNGKGDFNDKVQAIAADASNNIYTTGWTMAEGQQRNMITQKINAAGVTQWVKTFDGTTENDEGDALAVNSAGDVFVAGYSNGAGTYDDIQVMKYNTSGLLQWMANYNSPYNQLDKATSIVLSAAGEIYITGYSDQLISTTSTNYDYITIKYNALGLLQWVARYNGTGNANDKAQKIVASGSSVYVTGTSSNGINDDIVTVKYDMATGTQLAVSTHNGSGDGNDTGEDMYISGSNVYVTGSSFRITGGSDFVTIKLDTLLNTLWTSTYNGPANSTDEAHAIVVSGTEVYVTGTSIGTSLSDDIALLKYNANTGAQNWVKRYTSGGSFEDEAYSIAYDAATGNIYAGGESGNAANISDFVYMNYTASGKKIATPKYNGTGNGEDIGKKLLLDNAGYLYLTGYSTGTGNSNFDFTTIKYCTPVPDAVITPSGPTTFCLGGSVDLVATTGTGFTYIWKNGTTVIAGATSNTYTATTAGTYSVTVTNANGCSKSSKKVKVTIPCREGEVISEGNDNVLLYPNPYTTSATIAFTHPLEEDMEMQIFDISGRLVESMVINKGNASFEFGEELIQGAYTIIITGSSSQEIMQLIKLNN